jgi:hypothetical protein
MNHDEHPNDTGLTRELRDSLSELAAPDRPPLRAIIDRGRAHRRRRRARFAGLGATGVAASGALALGLTGVLGAAPASGIGAIRSSAAHGTDTIRTAAFTLTSNANGTDTLTLTRSQMFDPAALQRALAQHGIPALVKTGTYCSSSPAAPDPASLGVLSIRPPVKPPHPGAIRVPSDLKPPDLRQIIDHTVTVINPAAMPSGTELFFGYFNSDHALFVDLIYAKSYTCSSGQQPPAAP